MLPDQYFSSAAQKLVDQINAGIESGDAAAIRAALASCAVAVSTGEISASDGDAVVSVGRAGNKAMRAAAQRMRVELRATAVSDRQRKLEQATNTTLSPDQFIRIDQTNLGTQLLAASEPPKSRTRKRLR